MNVFGIDTDPPEFVHCASCGCEVFARSSRWKTLRETKATFWCPNGHQNVFAKAPWERDLDAARARADKAEREAAAAFQRTVRAEREADDLRRRLAGECKLCGRTFDGARGLAVHTSRVHKKPRALAANAGPDAKGSGYGIH